MEQEEHFEIIGLKALAESNDGLVDGYIEASTNGDMMDSVKNDKNGIGYISLSGLSGSGLKGLEFNGVAATEANVLNDTYELKRPFMYIRKADADIGSEIEKQLVAAFLAFMDSKDGKEIIKNKDGIVGGIDTAPTWDSIKDQHAAALAEGDQVEIHFGGSTSVEKLQEHYHQHSQHYHQDLSLCTIIQVQVQLMKELEQMVIYTLVLQVET